MLKGIWYFYIFMLFCVVSISCDNNENYLFNYAQSLHNASEPKKPILNFVKKTQKLSPDIRLAKYYEYLLMHWEFKADRPGEDIVSNANQLIDSKSLEGDCEDFSVILMSINKTIGLTSRFCLGTSKRDSLKGHIWIETMLSEKKCFDKTFKKRIINNFNNSKFPNSFSLINRNDTIWIQLNPTEMLVHYKLTHIVDMQGNLLKYNNYGL